MKKSNIKQSTQAGFTLIELIVVIVILGILAATALPKFTSLGGDARLASLQAAKGALNATVAMAKGKYMANATGTPLVNVAVEDATVTFVAAAANGYAAADAGLAKAAGLSEDYEIMTGVIANTATRPANAAGEITIVPKSVVGTASSLTCNLKYQQPTTVGGLPVVTLTATTASDCE